MCRFRSPLGKPHLCLKSPPPPDLLANAQRDRNIRTWSPGGAALGRPVGLAAAEGPVAQVLGIAAQEEAGVCHPISSSLVSSLCTAELPPCTLLLACVLGSRDGSWFLGSSALVVPLGEDSPLSLPFPPHLGHKPEATREYRKCSQPVFAPPHLPPPMNGSGPWDG